MRYETMTLNDIKALPVADIAGEKAHLYLWVPNALLPDGLAVMDAWGFEYKGNIVWEKSARMVARMAVVLVFILEM